MDLNDDPVMIAKDEMKFEASEKETSEGTKVVSGQLLPLPLLIPTKSSEAHGKQDG